MSERALRHRSEPEFLDWLQHQERRHELVDSVPMMTADADARHDRIVVNTLVSLGQQLRDAPCQPYSADTAIRIPHGNVRFPDLLVDCGDRNPGSLVADQPTLVVEVLSPSTRVFDQNDKLAEHKSVESIVYVLLVNPLEPDVRLHTRAKATEWTVTPIRGLEGTVELSAVGATLELAEIYRRVTFTPHPRLVVLEGTAPDGEAE